MAGIAQASSDGTMGRPKGWSLTATEAERMGKPAGRVELTAEEKKKLRCYRYMSKVFTATHVRPADWSSALNPVVTPAL